MPAPMAEKQNPFGRLRGILKNHDRIVPDNRTNTPITPVSSFSVKSVVLLEWWLVRVLDDAIAVAGFAERLRGGTRMFCSAPICKRNNLTTIETTDGITIVIGGMLNRSRTHQNGFSFKVCNNFLLGFPHNWKEYLHVIKHEESTGDDFPETSKVGSSSFPPPVGTLSASQIRDFVMCLPEDDKISHNAPRKPLASSFRPNKSLGMYDKHQKIKLERELFNPVDRTAGIVTRSRSRKLT